MEQSALFNYVKNQYLLGAFTESNLIVLVTRGIVTDDERVQIVSLKDVS